MRQAASTRPSALKALLLTLRPEQWIKNLLVFAGVMFGGRLLDVSSLWAATTTFAVFCGLAWVGLVEWRKSLRRVEPGLASSY